MTDTSIAALDEPGIDLQVAQAPPRNEYLDLVREPAAPAVQPAANPYVDLLKQDQAERETRLRAAAVNAQGSSPDLAAKALILSRKTGMPADLVERNLPEVETRQKANEYADLMRRAPKMADWLAQDPVNAKVMAQDDVEKLGFVEWTVNELYRPYLSQQASSNLAGVKTATRRLSELESALGRQQRGEYLSPFDKEMIRQEPEIRDAMRGFIIQYGTQREEKLQAAAALPELPVIKEMQKAGEAGDWGGVFSALMKDPVRAAYVIALQGSAMLPWQIAGYAAGGLPGTFGVSFGMEYMGAVEDALKQSGVNTQDPTQIVAAFGNAELMAKIERQAATKASVIGALDAASMRMARVPLGVGKSAVTRTATDLGAQMVVQAGLGGAGEALGSVAAGMKVDPFAVVSEVIGEFGSGPAEVAGARWGQAVRQDATTKEFEAFRAMPPVQQLAVAQAMAVDRLIEQVTNTKIAALSPEKLQEFIGSVTDTAQSVFVPLSAIASYMQDMTGLQAEQFMDRLGIVDQIERARVTGEDIAIPLATYIVNASEAHKAWREEIRTEVDGFSVRQAQEWEKAKASELKALQDRFEEHVQSGMPPDPQGVVYQQVLEMAKANGYTNDVAAQHAALYAARYAARAARRPDLYVDALDAFEKAGTGKGLRIQTMLADGTRVMGPDVLDSMLDSLRSGKDPVRLPKMAKPAKAVGPAQDATILKAAKRLAKGWTPEKAVKKPQSLTDFVRKAGGLNIDSSEGGDLRAADLGRIPGLLQKKRSGTKALQSTGQSVDMVAQAAREAGYRFGNETRYGSGVDVDAFLNALIEDAGGRRKVYPDDADTAAFLTQQEYFDEFFRWLKDDLGWEPKGRTPEEIANFLQKDDTTQRLMVLAERVDALGPDSDEAMQLDRELQRIADESLERLADEFAERDAAMADVDETDPEADTPSLSLDEWEQLHGDIEATLDPAEPLDGSVGEGRPARRGAQGTGGDPAGNGPAPQNPREAARARRDAALRKFQADRRQLADVLDSLGLDIAKMSNAQVREVLEREIKGQTLHQVDVGTDAFKKWFGDSKVAGEDGKPLVVYHGTDAADFDVFNPGAYFSEDRREASAYGFASDLGRREKATGKYTVVSGGAEFAGQRVEFYGVLSDIDDPPAGQVYAIDDGNVYRSLGNGRWEVFSDVAVDETGKFDGETMPIKLADRTEEARAVVDEYEAAVLDAFPGGERGRVYPVYLSIKNPVVLGPLEGNRLGRRLGASDESIKAEIAKYKAQGYDGIETTSDEGAANGETIRQWIPFDPSQIKSAIGNRGTYDPNDPRILYQGGDDRNLVAVHNLTAANLRHAAKMGGIAAPSIAILKGGEHPFSGFGEISLIAPPSMIDPADASSKVFAADVYSPRYPEVTFTFKYADLKKLEDRLKPYAEKSQERTVLDHDRMEREPMRYLGERNAAFMAEFLEQNGIEPEYSAGAYRTSSAFQKQIEVAGLQDEFTQHVENTIQSMKPKERIFKGFSNSTGNRTYAPHTIDVVLKMLTRNIRAGEGFSYGIGDIRAKLTAQFKSIAGIKKASDKLLSKEQFAKAKDEVQTAYNALESDLAGYAKYKQGFSSAFPEHLREMIDTRSVSRVLREYYEDVPAEIGVEVADFLNSLRNMPTEYFEAKIKRAVGVGEFAAAVVPDDATPATLKLLAEQGVTDIRTYKRGDEQDRMRAVREVERVFFQEARGQITFGDNATIIQLFQARDLSTLAHESGHLWLNELEFDVKSIGAGEQAKADWQTVLDFVGSTDGYITREQHELFARAFETYLMEGKAPSEGLRGVFRQFRNWLVSIYRNLRNLQAPISPEMRAVFDRLMATDEEIEAARNTQGLNPVFKDAKSADMTEAEFAAYTKRATQVVDEAEQAVLDKVMASIRRERTKEVAAEKAKIRAEVTDEMMAEPGQAALHLLRKGKLYSGETPEVLAGAKLSRNALVEMLGEAGLANLPAGVFTEEGIDPEVLAQAVGLGNGVELVDRLMQIQAEQMAMRAKGDNRSMLAARIAEETQKRLTESLGDPLNDGSIEAEAMAAVHSDKQGALMSTELKVLARKAKQSGTISLADIEDWAARQIAEMSVYQATQHAKYQRAERMAGQKVQRALIKGDFVAAFKAKQDQMVNFALYREAKKAADDVDAIRKLADRYGSAATIKSMDQGALEQIHQVLEEYDFKKRSGSLLAERTTFSMWAAEQAAAGFEVIEPPRLKGAGLRHYSQMTVEEIRGVGDTIKQIAHIGRWKQSMIDDGKRRDFEALVNEAVETIERQPQRGVSQVRRGTTRLQDVLGDVGSWFRSVDSALLKMETMFEWLDGDKTGRGVFGRFFRRVADAQVKERDLQKDLATKQKAIFDKVPAEQTKQWNTQHVVEELGVKLNKSQMIAVALNMGNASNMQKMLQGEGWAEEAVRAMLDKHLTAEEWQFVQSTWDLIETLWPETSALERRVNGVAPPKVEAVPVETRFGTLRGGYYPMAYDKAGDVKADRIAAMGSEGLFDPEYRRASTRAGSTHKRTEGFNAKVLLSLNVIGSHLNEVAHDLAFREVVMDGYKFLSNDKVREAIRSALGAEYEKQTLVWLKAVANEWAIDRRGLEGFDKFLQTARANTAIVGMGFRISTMLSQTAGFANSIQRLGSASMLRGMRDFYRAPAGMQAFVHEKSGEMRNRANDLERDIRLALKRMEGKDSPLDNVRRFAFRGIALFDAAVSLPTWTGAYNKGLREGMSEAEAVGYADKMVRDTQGAGSVKDLSAFQRSSEPMKLLGMFYSYFNVFYNRQRGLVRDARAADSFSDYMDVVAQGFWLLVVPTLLGALLSGQGPDDEEEWWAWAARNVGFGVFSGVPVLRDAANTMSNEIAGKGVGGTRLSPVQSIADTGIRLYKDAEKLVQGKEVSRTAIKNAFNAAGYAFALPLGQVGASSQFVWDTLVEETQDPEGLLDWMKGLAYGPEKKK